jgi:histidinol-phosphate aminotransferase
MPIPPKSAIKHDEKETPTMTHVQNAVRMRPDLVAMQGYKSPSFPLETLVEQLQRPVSDIIKLDTNENPFGPPPKALAVMQNLAQELSVYPDIYAVKLRKALADYVGVPMEHLITGAGSDDVITLVSRLFLNPGDSIIDCPPTFSVYSLNADWIGAKVIKIPRRADFSVDVEAVERAALDSGAKLLFLCTPNNPDGSLMSLDEIEHLLNLPLVVVLDEAYIEFTERQSFAARVPTTPNLIVLRTFSKWAGLAGLRIGYGVVPLPIIEHLWKIKQPFNVNAVADVVARACLEEQDLLNTQTRILIEQRERLIAAMQAIPWLEPYPSHTNFVFAKVHGYAVPSIVAWLRERGILIRYYDRPGLQNYLRISMGTPEQMTRVIAELQAYEGQ